MQLMKRIFLMLIVNVFIMLTIGLIVGLLMAFFPGLGGYGSTGQIMILSLAWGFGGAFISLALSRVLAKWMQGVKLIDPATATGDERWLLQTVYKLATQAGISTMPEVGVWESPEVNAFCTGPSKNRSLVAVSTGILARMNKDELEGVLAHEISHAANGDMVTMTLVQGVVNSFVIFASWIIARAILRGDDKDRGGGFMEFMLRSALQTVLSMLAFVTVIAPFSRWREFRADAGAARLAGKSKMIAALNALQDSFRLPQQVSADPALATMKISSPSRASLFSTHPSLEERIQALKNMTVVN